MEFDPTLDACWGIVGVDRSCTRDEAAKVYRQRCLALHPDRTSKDVTSVDDIITDTDYMKRLNNAWEKVEEFLLKREVQPTTEVDVEIPVETPAQANVSKSKLTRFRWNYAHVKLLFKLLLAYEKRSDRPYNVQHGKVMIYYYK
jgi:hypothetical protein